MDQPPAWDRSKSGATSAPGSHGSCSGDLYTAYTVIAVPPQPDGAGAIGFFAVPYAIIAYPYMMLVLPRLWTTVTATATTFADFITPGRYGNRWLTVASPSQASSHGCPISPSNSSASAWWILASRASGPWPQPSSSLPPTPSSGLRAPHRHRQGRDALHHGPCRADRNPHQARRLRPHLRAGQPVIALHTPPATIFLRRGQVLGLLHVVQQLHRCSTPTRQRQYLAQRARTSSAATPPCCPPTASSSASSPCSATSHSPPESPQRPQRGRTLLFLKMFPQWLLDSASQP